MHLSTTGALAPFSAREPDAPYGAAPADIPPLGITADTHVTKTLAPGQPGTLAWTHHHGTALVCVRYRESADGSRRYTTVELVVDERINRRPPIPQKAAASVDGHDRDPSH